MLCIEGAEINMVKADSDGENCRLVERNDVEAMLVLVELDQIDVITTLSTGYRKQHQFSSEWYPLLSLPRIRMKVFRKLRWEWGFASMECSCLLRYCSKLAVFYL